MSRAGQNQKLQQFLSFQRNQIIINSEQQQRNKLNRFQTVYLIGMLQDPICPHNFILNFKFLLIDKLIPGLTLMILNLTQNTFQIINDLLLRAAQGHLIGKLINAALSFASLTINTPKSQPKLPNAAKQFINAASQREARQMKHHRGPEPGPEIGRTGRQITILTVKSKIQPFIQKIIITAGLSPARTEILTGADKLQPQMILFINHNADGLLPININRSTGQRLTLLPADKVPFHQHLLFQLIHLLQVKTNQPGPPKLQQHFTNRVLNLLKNLLPGPVGKRHSHQIAGQPDPAADHDIIIRTIPG